MRIISIIPARGGSKGVPQKNIIDFAGKPLLAWTIEQAKESKLVSEVYVSSDSEDILKVAERFGAKTIKRPNDISGDSATSEAALAHALNVIKDVTKEKPDYVVFLQATSPLRKSGDIDNAIKKIKEDDADSLFSASLLGDFFVWKTKQGALQSVNYDYKNRKLRQEADKTFVENGSFYIFKPEILERYNNRLGGKITLYEMDFLQSFEIDDNSGLEICEWIFIKHFKK